MRQVQPPPFYRWGNQSTCKLPVLWKVTQSWEVWERGCRCQYVRWTLATVAVMIMANTWGFWGCTGTIFSLSHQPRETKAWEGWHMPKVTLPQSRAGPGLGLVVWLRLSSLPLTVNGTGPRWTVIELMDWNWNVLNPSPGLLPPLSIHHPFKVQRSVQHFALSGAGGYLTWFL